MKLLFAMILTLALPVFVRHSPAAGQNSPKEIIAASGEGIDINNGWRFHYGDLSGAEAVSYDDMEWDNVNLPHDYSISLPYNRNGKSESAYKIPSPAWYRKTLTISSDFQDSRVVLHFEGSYMNTSVWVNGTRCGVNPYGYNMFSFDITDLVNFGRSNVIAVRINYQNFNSRWYSGAGIYRNVKLFITPKIHFEEDSLVFTTPDLSNENVTEKTARAVFSVKNDDLYAGQAAVKTSLYLWDKTTGGKGSLVASHNETKRVSAGASANFQHELKVSDPQLWSPDEPNLYVLRVELTLNGSLAQTLEQEVGFRYFSFDNNKGFSLNGKRMKLFGVCLHHDQGALGAAAYADAIERQLTILKEMGVNAIRVSHNPSNRALKDTANRLGLMLIEESFDTWLYPKNGNTYDFSNWFNGTIGSENGRLLHAVIGRTWSEFTLKQVVRAGINDPSVIMWSLGNELMQDVGGSDFSRYPEIMTRLIGYVRELDQDRVVTYGDNYLKVNNDNANAIGAAVAAAGGVVGVNYTVAGENDRIHSRFPQWNLLGSEVASSTNSRGVYNENKYDRQLSAYDESAARWGNYAAQVMYDHFMRDHIAGLFVWTGFDYLGEPTPWIHQGTGAVGNWPSPKNSYFGIVDTAGLPKDNYYLYQSQWNREVKTLHILPAWKGDMVKVGSDGKVRVDVYSTAPSVELFVNGVSYGVKTMVKKVTAAGHSFYWSDDNDPNNPNYRNLYRTWRVPFSAGEIRAVAYDCQGNVVEDTVGVNTRRTYGNAASLKAEAYKAAVPADDHSLNYITLSVVDANGELVQNAGHRINVNVAGPARLIALDNGNSLDHDAYQAQSRRAFNGQMVAILRMTGEPGTVNVTASASGLRGGSVSFSVVSDGKNRLKEELITSGSMPSGQKNLAPFASIYQSIPIEQQSDMLAAVTDGVKVIQPNADGANPQIWSNYDAAQAGASSASITFAFEETQEVRTVVLYQFTDDWAADLPRSVSFTVQGETSGSYSGTLVNETRLSDATVKRVYQFSNPLRVNRLTVTEQAKSGTNARSGKNYCVGLSEVEIY